MILRNNTAYYIQTPFDVQPHVSQSSLCLLDTEAQTKIIVRWYNPSHQLSFIKNATSDPLTLLEKEPSLILWQLKPHARIGDLQVRSRFLVPDSLAVNMLLQAGTTDQHLLGIFQNELKEIPRRLRTIGILSSSSKTVPITVTTDNFDIIQSTAGDGNFKVTEQVQLKPISATPITAICNARGLLRFKLNMDPVQLQHFACRPNNGSNADYTASHITS